MTAGLPPGELVDLLDWKRRVFALYAEVRTAPDPRTAWDRWRSVRDDLFRTHPQSPLPAAERHAFTGLRYFEHDPSVRVAARVTPAEPERIAIAGSAGTSFGFTRFARAEFELGGSAQALGLYWLEGYGGGLFLAFRDATSGTETYGACRYLLDTVKGADLGMDGDRVVLDFNFAYNPSCAYDPSWACPLAPYDDRLEVPVRAGERAPGTSEGPA